MLPLLRYDCLVLYLNPSSTKLISAHTPLMTLLQVLGLVLGLPHFLEVLFNLAATTTLIIWDTFLTLDEEVEFIWSTNFTFVKFLFFVVRYFAIICFCGFILGFFGNTKADLCRGVVWFIPIGGSIITACSNMLLVQRVYAFYGRCKYIFWTLGLGFVLSEISVLVIVITGLPDLRVAENNLPSPIPELFGRCSAESHYLVLAYMWIPKLIFEAIAFAFIVGRFAKLQFRAWKTGVPNPQLYIVFLRDGAWTFFILFLLFLSTGILVHAQIVASLSLVLWSFALSSICSNRLMLNLHNAAKKAQSSRSPSRGSQITLSIVIDSE